MEKLEIKINDKVYTAAKPKARLWKKLVNFDEHKGDLSAEEFIDAHAEIMAEVFPELDKDFILDNVDLDEILNIYYKIFMWMTKLLTSKLNNVKNAEGDN
ncbi:MAG: hypothetical protein J6O04_01445 [Selenomonadaceae bacterium]|nr:hypothetical protein [Selenomonadaceae bacterium]